MVDSKHKWQISGAMHLNIKNPEAHRLAQAIARATGESMTHVVTEALRIRYAEIEKRRRRPTLEALRAFVDEIAVDAPSGQIPHGDFLYNEHGLPK